MRFIFMLQFEVVEFWEDKVDDIVSFFEKENKNKLLYNTSIYYIQELVTQIDLQLLKMYNFLYLLVSNLEVIVQLLMDKIVYCI